MFIKINDKIINLTNVSNIHILERKKRIIFNMNYSVQIKTNQGVQRNVSDYVYWDAFSEEEMKENLKTLWSDETFIGTFLSGVDDNVCINTAEISTVKFIDRKNRVIFNLSHPVTYNDKDNVQRITSDFVYVDCISQETFGAYVKYVQEMLGNFK